MRALTRFRREEEGIGVVAAVIVGFVLFASSATWLSMSVHQSSGSAQERDRERAFAAAEAGVTHAMNMMSFDAAVCPGLDGQPAMTGTLDGGGEYEFRFVAPEARFSCSDLTTVDRYIVAKGWAPSKDAPRAQRRQVEQQIRLAPLGGFKYALFASPGGVQSGNFMNVDGDVYSALEISIAQQSNVYGDVTGQQTVAIHNRSSVSGTVWARGDISLLGANSLVQGDTKTSGGEKLDRNGSSTGTVYAGNIANAGKIEQKALAPGAITGTGSFGSKVIGPVKPPPRRALPTFDPDDVTYDGPAVTADTFNSYWLAHRDNFSGLHRVTGTGRIEFNPHSTKVKSGETTMVVADGPIWLGRNVSGTVANQLATIVLVSMAVSDESSATPSILLSNQQKFGENSSVVLFAPNGCVEFRNLKDFTGTVYAKCLKMDNNFTLRYLEPPPIPGFDWTVAASTRFEIEAHVFREVPFQP